MSESDLVARTRQLLADPNVSPLPWLVYLNIHGDPYVVNDPQRPTFSTVATVSKANDDYGRADCHLIAAGVSALPALLADNERLTTQLQEDVRVMSDSSAAKIALIRRAKEAEARADAAEARLTQLTEVAIEQWKTNHAEHCTNTEHEPDDICYWPMPAELSPDA